MLSVDTAGLAGDSCTRINWELFQENGHTSVENFHIFFLLINCELILILKYIIRLHYIFRGD